MKKLILLLVVLPMLSFGNDSGDHDHGPAATASSDRYFSSEAVSDKYELFLKYDPIGIYEPAVLRLFISEYLTNIPLDSATIKVQVQGEKDIKLELRHLDRGYY